MNDEDRRIFLEALENLPKDIRNAKYDGAPRSRGTARKTRSRSVYDIILDLHGNTRETALARLRNTLLRERGKYRRILIVTGRGNNSADGMGVLRDAVGRFLETEGAAFVREYGFAGPEHGGDGAYDILTV